MRNEHVVVAGGGWRFACRVAAENVRQGYKLYFDTNPGDVAGFRVMP